MIPTTKGKAPVEARGFPKERSKWAERAPYHTELLNRLDGLRIGRDGTYRARCPAHGSRGLSLAVKDTGDTLLVKCFAGCSAADVLAAVGLELADLFARPLIRGPLPHRERLPRIDLRETLRAIRHDVLLVAIIAADFVKVGTIDDQSRRALAQAASFLLDASEVAAR